jgi:hypothetical protein
MSNSVEKVTLSHGVELNIKNAVLRYRNFTGAPGKYNAAGNRNFCVMLEEEQAKQLLADGWNIKRLKPKDPEDWDQPYLQVTVAFGDYPPKIWSIRKDGNHTKYDESAVNSLDWAEFESVDLVISPSYWNVNGKSGVKAYLRAMYVVLYVDPFEEKYFNAPDSAISALTSDESDS